MPAYNFGIDWNNDGDWSDAGEDVTARVLGVDDVTVDYGRDQSRALSPVAAGSIAFDLLNTSREYSPENTSSPLNGLILPARPILAQVATTVLNGNPDFETSASGWTAFGSSTYTRSATYAYTGSWSGKLTSDAGADPRVESSTVAITGGTSYRYSGFVFSPISLGVNAHVAVNWFTSGGTYITSSIVQAALTAGVWRGLSATVVAPTNAGLAAMRFGLIGTPGAGTVVYGDFLRLTPAPTTLYRGFLDEYNVLPGRGERKIQLTGLDALAKLKSATATTDLYPSIRTGDAIAAVLDAAGWPATARDVDAGATTLRWWSLNNAEAWTAIQEIVAAEGSPALLTSDGNGNVVFRDRHHRLFTTLNANPTFEGSVASWTSFGGTLALNTTTSHNGQNSAQFTPDGTTATTGIASELVSAVAATKYTMTGWLRCAVSRSVTLNINWFNSSGTYLSTSGYSQTPAANTWTFYINEFTAPANTAYAQIIPTLGGTPSGASVMLCDNVRLQVAAASAAIWRDTGAEPLFSGPLVYDQGWRDVVNDVAFDVEERAPEADLSEIWTTDQTYVIAPSTSVYVTFSTDEPFLDADVSSYEVLTGSAGINIDPTQGTSATLQIYSGGTGGTVTNIKVTGHKVAVSRTITVSASDATSIAAYGSKSGPDSAGKASTEDAQALANLAVMQRKVRLPIVSLDINSDNATRLAQIMNRNLSDRITIVDAETGLNRDFTVEQIKHSVTEAGLLHTTTFGCEAVPTGAGLDDPTTVFIFDHPTNGKFGTGRWAS